MQSSDLCLDLETLKGEMELDSENMGEEQDKLCRELASVQESLKRLRAQNAELSNDINEKNNFVPHNMKKLSWPGLFTYFFEDLLVFTHDLSQKTNTFGYNFPYKVFTFQESIQEVAIKIFPRQSLKKVTSCIKLNNSIFFLFDLSPIVN